MAPPALRRSSFFLQAGYFLPRLSRFEVVAALSRLFFLGIRVVRSVSLGLPWKGEITVVDADVLRLAPLPEVCGAQPHQTYWASPVPKGGDLAHVADATVGLFAEDGGADELAASPGEALSAST